MQELRLPLDQILHGDCVEILNSLPEQSVDLIFADPPYNLQLQQELYRPDMSKVDAVDDDWDRFEGFAQYDRFTRAWLAACRRVLKDTGTIWVIGSYHNIYRVGSLLMDLNYWILNDVTWIKCLVGETMVLVRDLTGWISQRTLRELASGPSKYLDILCPGGWRRLIGVARSTQLKNQVRLRAGYMTEIVASPDHLIPVWRNNYGEKYREKSAAVLASEKAQTYAMCVDISSHLSGQYTEVDIPELLAKDNISAFVKGGYSQYKETRPYGGWAKNLLQQYDFPNLHWYIYKDWLPLSVAADEGLVLESITSRYSKQQEIFPAKLQLTEDWGFLIGLYLAEGNMNKNSQIRFSLYKKETYLAERLEKLLNVYGIELFRHYHGSNSMAVYFGSRIVRAIIGHFVHGHGAHTKSLVIDRILNTPMVFRKGIMEGFLAGDGHYEANNDRYTVGLANVTLIRDLQLLAQTLGYYATIGRGEVFLKATGKHYKVYYLKIYKRQCKIAGDIEFHPVRAELQVGSESIAEWYDLTVEGGLFLVNGGLVVHNSNPMPNFRGVRFANAHETLLWAQKRKGARYTFNYDAMKALNDGLQMRSDWDIPLCTGAERIKVNGEKAHATQKPEALLYRVVISSSNPGDVVLDPFFGTGTTGAVAKKLHRRWIGVERDARYVDVARRRIGAIEPAPFDAPVFALPNRRDRPRIPFGALLERGLLQPGQTLSFGKTGALAATVLASGQLRHNGLTGSIHEVARAIQGAPCNGWEHWYYVDAQTGERLPIDALRERVRAEYGRET